MNRSLLLGILLTSGLAAAQTMPEPVSRRVSFAEDVHMILAERCFKCHHGEEKKGGFSMNSRESVLEGAQFGPVVEVGASAKSRLIEVVSGLDPEVVMPPKGDPLSAEQIGILRAWIDQGLEWDLQAMALTPGWEPPLEPRRPDVPEIRGIHGSDHPIDKFIAAYFEENEVKLPKVVEDHVFARRAYFDVIGLPPTIEELGDFLFQKNLEKRKNLTEQLLARDRDYAEHWMTFWNDHLRNDFTGTGYIDGGRKQITQWLYDALYYNRPYDQFARELIQPSTPSRGFTDGIVWRGVTAANHLPPLQAARSVAQVFMGELLQCASCHDSFVDDWKLADAYGLASFFTDEPLEMVRCDQPTGQMAETKFLWEELGGVDATLPRGAKMARLAELVTLEENGRFTRTFVNRVWASLMGRGLVEPLDKMGKKPWHPDLLDWLATEFAAMDYDTRALIALIMNSKAYQLESIATPPDAEEYTFAGPEAKRLGAEEFLDGLSRVTGVWNQEPKFDPPEMHIAGHGIGVRAWRVPSDTLTRALGRPNREYIVTRRENPYTTLQALELINGETLTQFLNNGAKALLEETPRSSVELVDVVYQRGLQRKPSAEESALAVELVGAAPTQESVADLLWAMAMLPEFQLIY